jgi:glycosyltransferase involved in cell wall biosynthesis
MHVVGDGPLRRALEEKAKKTYHPFKVHGALPRQQVFEIYKQCHFLVLPSQSEGFAKVIAEAANFGCIPLASAVASIPQYIRNGQEGFLWEPENESFTPWFHNLVEELLKVNLKKIAEESYKVARLFTFDRYLHRINHEILKLKNPPL